MNKNAKIKVMSREKRTNMRTNKKSNKMIELYIRK